MLVNDSFINRFLSAYYVPGAVPVGANCGTGGFKNNFITDILFLKQGLLFLKWDFLVSFE